MKKKCFIAAFLFVVGMAVYGQPATESFGYRNDTYTNDSGLSALSFFNDQIRRNPNDVYAYVNRGNMYFGSGDFDRAFADYDKAIELEPTSLVAYVNRGNAYYMRKDYDKSIADYTYAATLALDDYEQAGIFHALSVVYAAKGDQEQAEKNLDEAKRLDPRYLGERFIAFPPNRPATNGRYQGNHALISSFTDQIRRNPNDVYAYVNRGNTYFGSGDFDRAFADYDKAIELDPTYLLAYVNRGNAYYKRKDYDKSIADYTYAATLSLDDSEQAGIFKALSVVYAAKGDQEQAEKNLDEAKRLNPSYRGERAVPNIPKVIDLYPSDVSRTLVNTYTIDMDALEFLDIDKVSVEVLKTDGDDFILKEFMEENEPNFYTTFKSNGNTLTLSSKRQDDVSLETHRVELYIPRSVHKLEVLVRSGNIFIKNSVEELDMRVQTGFANVEDFSGKGTFDISSGIFSLKVADMKGDISVSMDSGILSLEISEDVSYTLDMAMISGLLNGVTVSSRSPRKFKETIRTDPEYTLALNCASGIVTLVK